MMKFISDSLEIHLIFIENKNKEGQIKVEVRVTKRLHDWIGDLGTGSGLLFN